MDSRDINKFIDRFEKSSLCSMDIEHEGTKISLKKYSWNRERCGELPEDDAVYRRDSKAAEDEKEKDSSASGLTAIKAPIVGVFYTRPAPDKEPYVKAGDKVKKGQVICLIEAMKMMNELKSPCDGYIRNILPESGQAVEFDQLLFEVEEC